MMDILTLVGNYAFPIVACICMAWYVKDITEKQREEVKELNKQHSDEMMMFKDEIKQALENNTLAINRLCERIDK